MLAADRPVALMAPAGAPPSALFIAEIVPCPDPNNAAGSPAGVLAEDPPPGPVRIGHAIYGTRCGFGRGAVPYEPAAVVFVQDDCRRRRLAWTQQPAPT